MQVVSDSDIIIHLAKLNELKLIKKLYGRAYIPRYVELEMRNKLKASEFRLHPNIIDSAMDSLEELE